MAESYVQEPEIGSLDKVFFWGSILATLWFIGGTVVFTLSPPALYWSNLISGGLLLILGAAIYWEAVTKKAVWAIVPFAAFLLGAWITGSPFLLYSAAANAPIGWTNIFPGFIIMLFALTQTFLRIHA